LNLAADESIFSSVSSKSGLTPLAPLFSALEPQRVDARDDRAQVGLSKPRSLSLLHGRDDGLIEREELAGALLPRLQERAAAHPGRRRSLEHRVVCAAANGPFFS
jgi:hypothetical protein